MQITGSVFARKIAFRIPAGGGAFIERWVNAFLVTGREGCLIDAGVAGSAPSLLAMVKEAGRLPGDIPALVLTHSHPDHIGGAPAIRKATECLVAAHPAELAWIEDPSREARERPVPGFSTLVEGPVQVDRLLADGDRVGLGGDRALVVLHTPGHSPGSISLFLGDEGVLLAGDAVPVKGEIPVYDDPAASLRSIGRLRELEGVKVLLASWDRPKRGAEVEQALEEGEEVIRTLHDAVARASLAEKDPAGATKRVMSDLGLPQAAFPVILRTVAGHLRLVERGAGIDPGL